MKQPEIKIGMAVWHDGNIWYVWTLIDYSRIVLIRYTNGKMDYDNYLRIHAFSDEIRIAQTYPLRNSMITING